MVDTTFCGQVESKADRGQLPMTKTKKLQGKVAVTTGGTTGIGLAAAKLFCARSAYVFITGRRQKELDEAVKTIGSNVTGVQGDIAKLTDIDRLYKIVATKGRIDVVFAPGPMRRSANSHLMWAHSSRPRARSLSRLASKFG
jgi:hypothetical protein